MIRPRALSYARLLGCLTLVFMLRVRANEAAATASPLSALSSAKAAAASAVSGPEQPELGGSKAPTLTAESVKNPKAKSEAQGLLNLGASLTERASPDFEAAEIAFRQVLNSPDADASEVKSALLGLGHMHRKRGDFTKAAAIYERYLTDYPGDDRSPDALLALGRTLRDMGAYKLAITRFYSVINSTLKVAGADFERYQVLAKTAQFEIAETHFDAGEYEDANKYYTKFRLLDVAPEDRARAHFKAADSLRRQGNLDGAVTALRAFIEQWPDDANIPEARYLLALTLRDLKRPQEAFAVALELLKTEKSKVSTAPKRWLHWQLLTGNQLANEFFSAGNILNAHTIYSSLLELSPEVNWRIPITYQLGLCYERLGILETAKSSYQSVLDLAGPQPAPEFAELAQMAAWRIQHLAWKDKVAHDVAAFFDSTTGKQAGIPAAGSKAAATP